MKMDNQDLKDVIFEAFDNINYISWNPDNPRENLLAWIINAQDILKKAMDKIDKIEVESEGK